MLLNLQQLETREENFLYTELLEKMEFAASITEQEIQLIISNLNRFYF